MKEEQSIADAEKLSNSGDRRESIQYRLMWSQNEIPVFPFSLGINVCSVPEYKGHSEKRMLTPVTSQNSRL